jgi:hypothetical protein
LGFLFAAFVGGVVCKCSVGSIVVLVVLPLLEIVVEEVHVVDDLALEQSIELLRLNPARTFDLSLSRGVAGLI